jgi:hypothetical protein
MNERAYPRSRSSTSDVQEHHGRLLEGRLCHVFGIHRCFQTTRSWTTPVRTLPTIGSITILGGSSGSSRRRSRLRFRDAAELLPRHSPSRPAVIPRPIAIFSIMPAFGVVEHPVDVELVETLVDDELLGHLGRVRLPPTPHWRSRQSDLRSICWYDCKGRLRPCFFNSDYRDRGASAFE